MTAQPHQYMIEEEYLAFERSSTTKHEYYAGRIYAMTGAKEPHNLIAGNLVAAFHPQLRRKPCRVYASDMRIKVVTTGLNTYPDIVIVCGQPQFTDAVRDTITNPIVLVEILSASTERYDRGMKFEHYRTISTLCDYILVAQDRHHVEHFARQEGGLWVFQEATHASAELYIPSIDCTLKLEDMYEKVDFEEGVSEITREILPDE
ncbi:Uma2 family endonuclease [Candidatus Gracilibacteria bacterium]|nr:Uma2 family endonuclease [Candidatus Gracilibacteria bacterium]